MLLDVITIGGVPLKLHSLHCIYLPYWPRVGTPGQLMAEALRDRGYDRAPQLHFDYGSLDSETSQYVRERAGLIHSLAWKTARGVVDIGQALTEMKERLGPGKFLLWVGDEFAWGYDSATRFMNVYERFESVNLTDLQIDVSALYLIADQRTPDRRAR